MPQRLASRAMRTKAPTTAAGALRLRALSTSRAMARAAARRSVFPHHPLGTVRRAALSRARFSSLTTGAAGRAGGGLFFMNRAVVWHRANVRSVALSVIPRRGESFPRLGGVC